jgi:AICAR transformylase/IMP cyclohydrolase PurH
MSVCFHLNQAANRRDAEEAKKTPEQREAEAKAAKEAEEKKKAREEKAKAKAAAKADSKFGMKTGGPTKSVEKSDDFIPFRDSVRRIAFGMHCVVLPV